MRNISDTNDLNYFLNVIVLCETFENIANLMHEKNSFNPHRCNSTSTLSYCIQRNQSKVIIVQKLLNYFQKL